MTRSQGIVSSFSKGIVGATVAVAKFGAALAGVTTVAGFFATKTAAGFEQSMSKVRAISNATTKQFERLEKAARQLGRTTQFTATQVAEAQTQFALAGFKTNEILAALPSTLKLAVAGNLEIAAATNIASGIMGGMNLTANDLAASLEVLARGFTSSKTNIEELGEAFKFAGPIASASGRSLIEITAILQIFANANIEGSMAGTNLRSILLRLADPPAEAAKQFKKLNVAAATQFGIMRPLADVIDDVNRAFKSLTPEQRLAASGQIAGIRAASAFIKLTKAGGDAIRAREAALSAEGDTLGRISTVQMDTLTGAVKRVVSAFEGLQIAVGKILTKFVRPLAEGVARGLNIIELFIERNKLLIKGLISLSIFLVKKFFEFSGIAGAATKVLEFFGIRGNGALEKLIRGLAILENLFTNFGLVLKIIRTGFDLTMSNLAEDIRHLFGTIIPGILKNSIKAFVKYQKAITSLMLKVFLLNADLLRNPLKLLNPVKILKDLTRFGKTAVDQFGSAVDTLFAKLADRVPSLAELILTDKLDTLTQKFSDEVGKTVKEMEKAMKAADITPESGAFKAFIDQETQAALDALFRKKTPGVGGAFRGAPAAERGTVEAFRAKFRLGQRDVADNTKRTAEASEDIALSNKDIADFLRRGPEVLSLEFD